MSIACPLCGSAQVTELGDRSSFCDLEEYARYVENLERFDRTVNACSVCGLQFIWPMYGFRPVETINRHFRFENETLTHVFFCGVFERSQQGALPSVHPDSLRVYRSVYESVQRDFLDLIRLRLEDRPAPARKRGPEIEAEDSSKEHEESPAKNERHGEREAEERAGENDVDASSFVGRLRGLLYGFAAKASTERSDFDERPPKPSEP